MINKYVVIPLTFLFVVLSFFPNVQAETTIEEKENIEFQKQICTDHEEVMNEKALEDINTYKKDEASIPEEYVIEVIESLFHITGINTMANLILGNPYCVWNGQDSDEIIFGMYSTVEMNTLISPIIKTLTGTYVFFVTLAILISALKVGIRAYSPQARADFWQDIQMWILSALFMLLLWPLVNQLFIINDAFVSVMRGLLDEHGIDYDGLSTVGFLAIVTFTDILVYLVEWGLSLYLNGVYILRKLLITLLLLISPIAAASLLYQKTRDFFGTWIKELIGLIFLQSVHSLVLVIFLILSTFITGITGVLFKIALMLLFVPLTSMLSNWLQMGESGTEASKGSMLGTGGLLATTKLLRRAPKQVSNIKNAAKNSAQTAETFSKMQG